MNPEDVYTLIAVTWEHHFLWQQRLPSCDYVKDTEMRYPGLLEWAQCYHLGPCKREARGMESEKKMVDGWNDAIKEGTMSQGMQASRNRKKKKTKKKHPENRFFLQPP